MMFQIRFNLLGGCFACRCFCSSASFCNFICLGIHFRAVGLEIFKAFAHCEMFPVGFSLYHVSTRACRVGAPFLLMYGLSVVNLAILFTSCCYTAGRGKTSLSRSFSLITAVGSHRQQKGHLPGTHGRVYVGQVSCVRRESAAVNGQEQNGLIGTDTLILIYFLVCEIIFPSVGNFPGLFLFSFREIPGKGFKVFACLFYIGCNCVKFGLFVLDGII